MTDRRIGPSERRAPLIRLDEDRCRSRVLRPHRLVVKQKLTIQKPPLGEHPTLPHLGRVVPVPRLLLDDRLDLALGYRKTARGLGNADSINESFNNELMIGAHAAFLALLRSRRHARASD